MKLDPRIVALKADVTQWRRDLHENPELMFDVHRTADVVAKRLREFGCDEVVTGVGRSGVVGVLHGRNGPGGKVVGLRADMDALPIFEETNLPHRSKVEGKMHACGHDGHTAMLLGAARHMAATREFDGTVVFVFQPAEEGGAGGKAMVDDGLMERFGISEIYGMHNLPGLTPGHFSTRPGPIMAATDQFFITIEGRGGHAAKPHEGIDPVLVGAHIITALQSIASRMVDPLESVVVSTTMVEAGTATNIIPSRVKLAGTVRTLKPEIRDLAEERLGQLVKGVAAGFGAQASVTYERGYPPTINHVAETRHAVDVARAIAGDAHVDPEAAAMMGAEDFSYMLEARPGAFIFIGNGNSAGLHHPAYDFNDEIIPVGMQYWTDLVTARTMA
ncbi:MAG: M20 family metallopeptidase [Proteobacteria bacterium]|nr:M20 family metallopeptidase [Pseudomonadota bacterium]